MKKIFSLLLVTSLLSTSCESFLDINDDPNSVTKVGVNQLLPSVTVNVGYLGASDLFRVAGVFSQQFSGQGPVNGHVAFKEYERYNVNDSDINNQWVAIFGTTLSDISILIEQATAEGSPHYAGVAKLLKAYVYQITVDTWGDVPYFNASQHNENRTPEVDDDEAIYADLIRLIDEGISDIKSSSSTLSPNSFSTIYNANSWDASRDKWEKFANTLKLRIYLHYSAKDPAFTRQKIAELINSGAKFFEGNEDSFQMAFTSSPQRQNPVYSIELGQFRNQFLPNKYIVELMNGNEDPRREKFFTPSPYYSNPKTYKGASVLDGGASSSYSRLHEYLYGSVASFNPGLIDSEGNIQTGALTYSGASPARLLTYAEYNFIRAEAALLYDAPGDADAFFKAGIRASFAEGGLSEAALSSYLATKGTLTGSNQQKLEQIITEKYIANFGVVVEPWTDYRRTGYPSLTPLSQPLAIYSEVPRTLYYSQSEINNNPNVKQKANLLERVFWDTKQ
ncbi:SusD/RagB family nutrient-binding outer membrane lipoprotein [Sphingobacterium wenxiniae]|uniref:Starch-binding associating with outer membrane n=1 Tax=Sphingobacterium wenxiniae TaxID=683125 RepID=A0A1I6VG16_9SPHI|nr:SusD/RagB family nutrient-binding outer membrane lipoprotein [Sphingobacterium wenxiniae]SFT12686.1 Starch-binding associating with outer membrane [Sphingobacterium wenxiniae]